MAGKLKGEGEKDSLLLDLTLCHKFLLLYYMCTSAVATCETRSANQFIPKTRLVIYFFHGPAGSYTSWEMGLWGSQRGKLMKDLVIGNGVVLLVICYKNINRDK